MLIKHLTFVFLIMAYVSCSNKTGTSTSNEAGKSTATKSLPVKDFEKEGFIKAVVINMTELDGCDHLIELESGKKLEPTTLAQEFKEDKLKRRKRAKATALSNQGSPRGFMARGRKKSREHARDANPQNRPRRLRTLKSQPYERTAEKRVARRDIEEGLSEY